LGTAAGEDTRSPFLLIFFILGAIKAYQGQYYKLPIIGDIAWNIVNKWFSNDSKHEQEKLKMDTGKSALGLEGNLAAALGYPIGILALICLIMEKENRFVKFHALQSILLHVAFIIIIIVVWILGIILLFAGIAASAATNSGALGGLMSMLFGLIWLVVIVAYLGGLIFAAVKAYGGDYFKLPIVGNMAEKFANK
jgi:uncharacterized membrane protein